MLSIPILLIPAALIRFLIARKPLPKWAAVTVSAVILLLGVFCFATLHAQMGSNKFTQDTPFAVAASFISYSILIYEKK